MFILIVGGALARNICLEGWGHLTVWLGWSYNGSSDAPFGVPLQSVERHGLFGMHGGLWECVLHKVRNVK